MRYIDLARLRMPDGWIVKSKAAALAVSCGQPIDSYSSVWKELKTALAALSNEKCWYCESPIDRADNAIDHFRPKNRVHEASKPHGGYRWLAFESSNFRYSCTFCNSKRIDVAFGTVGGKADRFPLVDENKRVYTEGPIDNEEPELLDPCKLYDCELLGCQQENGRPCSSSTEEIGKKRVECSIQIYHLDRQATCVRRHSIAVGLISDIMDAKDLFELSLANRSRYGEFLKVSNRIKRCLSPESPYSGEMKYLFRGQRSEQHPWMQILLEA